MLFLVTDFYASMSYDTELQQGKNAVDAAKEVWPVHIWTCMRSNPLQWLMFALWCAHKNVTDLCLVCACVGRHWLCGIQRP